MKLLFATGNEYKAKEVRRFLPDHINLVTLNDLGWREEIPEPYDTLEENARHKAQVLFDAVQIPCFAEDTGLEVEVLDGAPGVLTARYAGPEKNAGKNMDKLLAALNGEDIRRAQFRAALSYISEQRVCHIFEGINTGIIAQEKSSGSYGFGYDPIFIPDGYGVTQAEIHPDEKNTFSHRIKAVKQLAHFLHINA